MTRRQIRRSASPIAPRLTPLLAGLLALGAAGCGAEAIPPPPVPVPTELVPATLGTDLGLEEFVGARQSFADAGPTSLVADGRLWQVRRGAQLVGTLQVSTLKPTVSTASAGDRNDILDSVLTGSRRETIEVQGVAVAHATAADRTIFVWFGAKMFQVLQLKGTKVDPDQVVDQLLAYELSTGKLQAVGSVDEEDLEGTP